MYHREFDTLTDFAGFVDSKRALETSDYPGVLGLDDSLALARQGWSEGAAQCAALSTKLGNIAASRMVRHEPFYDTTGLELDVAEYISGRPECWLDVQPTYVPCSGQVITAVFNVAVSGAVSHNQLIKRGIALAAAVNALETAGRSVELWARLAVGSSANGEPLVIASVCVKRAGQPLDLGVVSYACAHPSMLRRLGLIFLDHCAAEQGIERVGKSYSHGSVATIPADLQGDVNMAGLSTCGMSDEAVVAWVTDTLKAQGIECS